jgi:hypothetical protein
MNPVVHEYVSDFARHYVAEGRAEGQAEVVVRLLTLRFGSLSEAIQTRIRDACMRLSDRLPDSVLTATTLEEALGSL